MTQTLVIDIDTTDDPMARWDAGLVEVGQECPNCHEQRMDWLAWDDDCELGRVRHAASHTCRRWCDDASDSS